jgi:inhibitor of KinA
MAIDALQFEWRIVPLGDRCLVVEFEQRVDAGINRKARALANALLAQPPHGVVDVVPTFCTVAVFYRPEQFAPEPSPFTQLRLMIEAVLEAGVASPEGQERTVRVPVCYGGQHGPDLDEVAAACGMAVDEVVRAHIASEHVVFMLGFSPGFPYIGGLDPRLSLPRRATPRTRIPAGTVAIARDQTAIYSLETPGGWNMIGRTPMKLFDPLADPPCRLQPGDHIRFFPIPPEEFDSPVHA